jgi:hypothetical protein
MKRRTALIGAGSAWASAWLVGCGGGPGPEDSTRRLRVLHASPGLGALDVYLDNDRRSAGLAYGAASAYRAVDSGVDVELTPAGSATVLLTTSPGLSADRDHTLVVWGPSGALKTQLLRDDTDDPDSGRFRLRVLHAAADTGALDVYLTGDLEAIDVAPPLAAGLASGTLGASQQRNGGTWRLRVTGAGDTDDLRLDLPGQVLSSGRNYTLVLVSGAGGVLVSAVLVAEGGAALALANPAARVRLVASVADNAVVAARVGETPLASAAVSPGVGDYKLVEAGTKGTTISVGGTTISSPTIDMAAGSDVTLLVTGTVAVPQIAVLVDDNRRPAGANQARIRMVHAAVPLAGAQAALSVDLTEVASAAFAAASDYATVATSTSADIAASSPLAATPPYSAIDQTLVAGAVYTLFLLTAGGEVQGKLLRED